MRIPGLVFVALAIVGCGDNIQPKVTVGGMVTGLLGSGLVIADNHGDTLAISENGVFAFATPYNDFAMYTVTVTTQPSGPAQVCAVSNGSGTIASAAGNVIDIAIDCSTSMFTVGGTVTGLSGTGMVLEDNGSDDLAIAGNGAFTFATPITSGGTFAVTIKTQPTGPVQTCTVSGATGTVIAANVTTVVVNCATDAFTIGGTVVGLASSAVLQDNGGDNITVSANGTFAFPTPVNSGQMYAVTVLTQPSGPTQVCVVTAGSGTVVDMNVTNVLVTCTTSSFTISVMVTGDAGTGLTLEDNGGDDLAIASDGTYTFATPVLSGAGYDVTVSVQPINPYQNCTVTNGVNTVGGVDVTGILVNCATDTYAVSIALSGVAGTIDVQDNGGDDLVETVDGTYAFPTPIASGSGYDVTIASQTVSQDCVIGNGSGTIVDTTELATITCTTISYNIGGTLSGLSATESVVLEDNLTDDLTLVANGTFQFATPVPSGQPYSVTVLTSPASPIAETCTVTNGANTVGFADVTNADVACAPTPFNVDVVVVGLTAGTLVLQDNGTDNLSVTANGTYPFATQVASGGGYDVTILDQPAGGLCAVTGVSTGTIGTADATVTVSCAASCFQLTNDANENLIGNTWFDTCANAVGNTVIVDLRDGSGNVLYHATGQKVGTWTPDNLLTSTDANQTPFGSGYLTDQYDPADHDQIITFDNGDNMIIPGKSAEQGACGGSLGDGYAIEIFTAPAAYLTNLKLMVIPYRSQNFQPGQPRGFVGWTPDMEISWASGAFMNSCYGDGYGGNGGPLTGQDGTFTFVVAP